MVSVTIKQILVIQPALHVHETSASITNRSAQKCICMITAHRLGEKAGGAAGRRGENDKQ